ncbi:MAG: alpha/beta hydrolase [Phyllobacterium sp.]|uniref:alpha/beta fold hydrolase n=1 Tax=Phyllobacterium sp. TaxID=1871046 RepID=UPI0030F027DD
MHDETNQNVWDLPHTFDYKGQPVRFNVTGTGAPLVFVHGTPFSSVIWRRIAPHFARSRRIYYYDLLGYGRSHMDDGQDVSLGVQNDVFAALLAHWQIDRPDIVAHDFGGATVLRTHLVNKVDYRSLTLIDPVAIAPWGSPFVQHVRKFQAAFSGLPAYIHDAILASYIGGAAFHPLSRESLDLYCTPWRGERGQAAFYRQIAQMDQRFTDEIADTLRDIRCPVSILWGDEDQWIPVERGYRLASMIPNAEFQATPCAGHLMQDDAPEAIVAALKEFLR